MKLRAFFSCFVVVLQINLLYGQTTITELGTKIFEAFRNDSLDYIKTVRLKQDELSTLFTFKKLDTNSTTFTNYYSKYPSISEKFYAKCASIKNDSSISKSDWKMASLKTIVLKNSDGKTIEAHEATENAMMQIRFIVRRKEYILILETFLGADKLWKVGNYIQLFQTKKT